MHLEKGSGVTDCMEIRENCFEYDVQFKPASLEKLLGKTVSFMSWCRPPTCTGFTSNRSSGAAVGFGPLVAVCPTFGAMVFGPPLGKQ